MTGTARSAAGEFYEIYGLRVVPVPTHRPPARVDLPPRLYFTPGDKLAYIVEQVQRSWQVRRGGGSRSVARARSPSWLVVGWFGL
jgi:preprotein translocase subunit SecA